MSSQLDGASLTNAGKYNMISLLCISIIVLNWFMNIGLFRVFYSVPMIIHVILFYFSNRTFHRMEYQKSNVMKLVNYAVYVSFLLFHILLPDTMGTAGSDRVFFGLITDTELIDTASVAAILLFGVNFILLLVQIVYNWRIGRKLRTELYKKAGLL
ncbi:hypothetical protein [Paenibacillus sp. 481]|uniref:hypothetical protein n=1 Tax=Paenibacillus sp. 481 TaxID=2835869 RepID=UPI001E4080D9|nr:hypothetical protein [Paenibacillus sp. 481]UHA73766.1 hypothetical protein KIK04_00920 [Paenibacillus sp. 481]